MKLHTFHWIAPAEDEPDVSYVISDGVVSVVTVLKLDGSIQHLSESELNDLTLDIMAQDSLRDAA